MKGAEFKVKTVMLGSQWLVRRPQGATILSNYQAVERKKGRVAGDEKMKCHRMVSFIFQGKGQLTSQKNSVSSGYTAHLKKWRHPLFLIHSVHLRHSL